MAEIPSLVPLHCAYCFKLVDDDGGIVCGKCSTPYCSVDCRAKDKTEGCRLLWNEATLDEETGEYVRPPRTRHIDICGEIARIGVEQHYAKVEAHQEALAAVRDCSEQIEQAARDLDEPPTCYICLEGGDGLVRECNCRGNSGFAHLDCLVQYARSQSPDGTFSFRWNSCRNCRSSFSGTMQLALARECWRTYCAKPEDNWRRMWALDNLVEPLLADHYYHPEALRAAEAFLATLQKHFSEQDPTGDRLVGAWDSLVGCYGKLGRHAEALKLSEDIHANHTRKQGPNHTRTLLAANNLAVVLAKCGFQARRRSLLRDAHERAVRTLGVEAETTHHLRNGLAATLWRVGDATREDMVEAAALLDISVQVARQTYGAEHEYIRFALGFRDDVVKTLEAFDRGSSQRPVKRQRTLRVRDVDRRAEIVNAGPTIPNEERMSRAKYRNQSTFVHYVNEGLISSSSWRAGEDGGDDDDDDDEEEEEEEEESEEESPPPPPREEGRSRCTIS